MQRLQGVMVGLVLGSVVTFTLPAFTQGPEERRLIEQMREREELHRKNAEREAEETREKVERAEEAMRAREEFLRQRVQRHAEEVQERMRRAQAEQHHEQEEHAERVMDNLREAAKFLERAGKHDAAHQAREEAERIERELHERHREGGPGSEAVLREVRELREQMGHLHRDIRGLHERLEQLTKQMERNARHVPRPATPFQNDWKPERPAEGKRPIQKERRLELPQEGDFGIPAVKIPKVETETASGVNDVAEASGDKKETSKNKAPQLPSEEAPKESETEENEQAVPAF
ncbi:MAG: hypothetical protein ACE37I_05590 [Rubinisphaera brasiliensis]|uniref:hypothetical protein n=1 Tax=Rubinisphaera brasiliensis TaxID=119 RepID=UPI00391BC438|nr:hypothetical protein [bacterium]